MNFPQSRLPTLPYNFGSPLQVQLWFISCTIPLALLIYSYGEKFRLSQIWILLQKWILIKRLLTNLRTPNFRQSMFSKLLKFQQCSEVLYYLTLYTDDIVESESGIENPIQMWMYWGYEVKNKTFTLLEDEVEVSPLVVYHRSPRSRAPSSWAVVVVSTWTWGRRDELESCAPCGGFSCFPAQITSWR